MRFKVHEENEPKIDVEEIKPKESQPKVEKVNTKPQEYIFPHPFRVEEIKVYPKIVSIVEQTKSEPKYDVLELDAEVKERIVEKGVGRIAINKG